MPFLVSKDWEPLFPMRRYGVYASRWPLQGETVWTIVNRGEYDLDGRQMSIPAEEGIRYFDLYHGVELQPEHDGGTSVLSFALEAHGYGAVLATRGAPQPWTQKLMSEMRTLTEKPPSSYSSDWKTLPQHLIDVRPVKPPTSVPENMIRIPGGNTVFTVQGIEIEENDDVGVDVQYPWEDTPRRFHEHRLQLKPFYIDKYPVTNAQYKKFMEATHYRAPDGLNFLRDWENGTWESKPVTWVSLDDARAYAAWAGKRLPHEWEWQFAAQGTDGRIYPWGNGWRADAVPIPDRSREMRGPDDVGAHPAGASPFGVMDLVGNVWQWTDEYVDEHTRGGIVRGGSYYQPQGSIWYFPQAYRNDQHGKLLLMAPSYDRSGAVGFRCVVDAE